MFHYVNVLLLHAVTRIFHLVRLHIRPLRRLAKVTSCSFRPGI